MKALARPQLSSTHLQSLKSRRNKLSNLLPNNSLIVLSSLPENSDYSSLAKYSSGSHFFYLTGINEPNSHLVMLKKNSEVQTILFLREKNFQFELWNGPMWGIENTSNDLGVQATQSSSDFEKFLASEAPRNCEQFFLQLSSLGQNTMRLIEIIGNNTRYLDLNHQVRDAGYLLHSLREIKDSFELECMKKANIVSSQAISQIMQKNFVGKSEKQIEADLEYFYKSNGLDGAAYLPIVASGANACCLHYQSNNCQIEQQDLILIDSGGSFQGYAADISRTFPANGKFQNTEHIRLYELVLHAQSEALKMLKPGVVWNVWHDKTCEVLTDGLLQLGIMHGSVEENIKNLAYKDFYPHGTSHYLGIDVHDKGKRMHSKIGLPLQEGMVITVEPGIYIQPSNLKVHEKWRGIGIRIEDDIVITKEGFENLTSTPKTISDIENLMAGKS